MEWITRLNKTINFIEEHLTDEIDYEELARIACCSSYHYQRMFGYMADVPLSEYIRRRRMSRAATDLQSGEKVADVSLKYGYSSPTAFNRAFQSIHGVAPSRVRDEGVLLKSYSPLSFKVVIKGVEEMQYRIEQKEAIRVVGVSVPLRKSIEENFEIVPKLWDKAKQDGTISKLSSMMNTAPTGILGVSRCNDLEDWRYYIAVASASPRGDLDEYLIPASTWAIFPGEGDVLSIQELERRIVTEWLPSSGYEYGNSADIEVYLNDDLEHAKYEVWIPVVRK
ncbi:AraC family transcriptional regulator [Ruminococcaceae bacterium OttesenSCG-928-A11]|nr:AraC family transcriptional regulator [Ruminococcaceae bacterium OttesenSCG-928-A11]